MRKINKMLFLMLLIATLVFAYPATVRAAENPDYSGYVELEDEPTTKETEKSDVKANDTTSSSANQTTNTTTNVNTTTNTNTATNANTATKPHQQAGKFETFKFITVYLATVTLIGIGYIKFKKYNY